MVSSFYCMNKHFNEVAKELNIMSFIEMFSFLDKFFIRFTEIWGLDEMFKSPVRLLAHFLLVKKLMSGLAKNV